MTRKISFLFLACLAALFFAGAGGARAASVFDIEFPIADLGGCADKAACKVYCDDASHGEACLAFAKKYGLVDQKTAAKAEAVEQKGGPGGCKGANECRAYCDDPGHETECIEHAVANGFMTRAEADRALKPGPGGCRGRACEQYCRDPSHETECFEFAAANGLIPKAELQRIREFKEKFKKRETGPGGCQGEQACRQYCEDPGHITECVSFAEENGFVNKEQAQIIKKTAGKGPGGCKGTNECRAYCEDPAHQRECIDFGEQNGFMTREEAARARKVTGKQGPGGCQGIQCRDFCNQPGNEQACLEFAEREDILPKEELARAKKFMAASRDGGPGGCRGVQCRDYCADPAHQEECFGFAKKQGLITKEEEKQFEAGSKLQEIVKTSGGPGGCKNDNECRAYCTDPSHAEECVAFGATHGGVPPEAARAMLKQFTERRFEAHGGVGEFGPQGFADFERFQGDTTRRFEEFRILEEQFRGQGFPGGPPGGFPGAGEFQGAPGEFPGGFPGGPGGFPGGFPGGPDGGAGGVFLGPGGCTSPAECIKYCTENRDACFGGPPPGSGSGRGAAGGFSDGERGFGGGFGEQGMPQLRGNLIHQFESDDLPEGFRQLPPEDREQFFHGQFPQFGPPRPGGSPSDGGFPGVPGEFPGRPGEFPGRPPEGFPGVPGEFPGRSGEFPSQAPAGFPGGQGLSGQGEPARSPEGFSGERIQQLQQLQQQIQQGGSNPELQQQLQQLQQSSAPSSGSIAPPTGTPLPPAGFHPPEGSFTQPSSGSIPPPSGSFSAPPPPSGSFSAPPPPSGSQPPPPPPSGQSGLLRFFGTILGPFLR